MSTAGTPDTSTDEATAPVEAGTAAEVDFEVGVSNAASLREIAQTFPNTPGVYRWLDAKGGVLYVGKARDLKKRVLSYFVESRQEPKIRALTRHATHLEFDRTHTENEALILESTLIKKHRPRYNVVLRDDKSYPYIFISTDERFPRLAFHRGARKRGGRYFGPYPSAGAVRSTLAQLQKLFRVRLCEDSYFENRTRACLQHQIERCTAPCVGKVDAARYAEDIRHTILFLEGRSQEVVDTLVRRMEQAAEALKFEEAARLRDQVRRLQRIQQGQVMVSGRPIDADIFSVAGHGRDFAVQVNFVRGGHYLGGRTFYPRVDAISAGSADVDTPASVASGAHVPDAHRSDAPITQDATEADAPPSPGSAVLNAFLPQYYFGGASLKEVPDEILLSHPVADAALLEAALSERAGRRVQLKTSVRSERARWLKQAEESAHLNLAQHTQRDARHQQRLAALADFLGTDEAIGRIECFDISHTRGEGTVASCVVFGDSGAANDEYRRFNITDITPGDDYAAMYQALSRRYQRRLKEGQPLPDVVLIDGGKGQLAQALAIADELGLAGVYFVGVAKGPTRKAGLETLILEAGEVERHLPTDSPALHLIQQVRDEAHRFAITGHRKRRANARNRSSLEDIPGVGAKRRQMLLKHFGGLQGLSRAGVEDLTRVPGISETLAREIHAALHPNG